MCTWDRPRKTEELSKMTETLTEMPSSAKYKCILGVVIWDLKAEEGNSHEVGRANVW